MHGYPVKVGDRVWSAIYQQYGIFCGLENSGKFNGTVFDPAYKVEIMGMVVLHSETILFWQPIDPSAIEAAKVKPKPVEYEWQWLYVDMDGYWETSGYVKGDGKPDLHPNHRLISRIEESKRGVNP